MDTSFLGMLNNHYYWFLCIKIIEGSNKKENELAFGGSKLYQVELFYIFYLL